MPREFISMEPDEVADFVAGETRCIVATLDPDGSPWGDAAACAYKDGLLYFRVAEGSRSARNLQAGGATGRGGRPAPMLALRDEVGGLVALVLEPLDQGGDVRAEVGQLQRPLVGEGALDRGSNAEAAERDGGQGRDGDEQQQAGADAPVLQPVPRRRTGQRRLGLGHPARAQVARPPILTVLTVSGSWVRGVTKRRARGRLLTLRHGAAVGILVATRAHSVWTSHLRAVASPQASRCCGGTDMAHPFRG